MSRSVRGRHREQFGTEWHEDEPWRRALRPRCCTLREHPSANDLVAQLGTRFLGLPERPRQSDLGPLAIGELELDTFPARHEVAVSVGLRDPDAVPGTGTPWTAVMPPACLHCTKLSVGLRGNYAALAHALRVSNSFRKVHPILVVGGNPDLARCGTSRMVWEGFATGKPSAELLNMKDVQHRSAEPEDFTFLATMLGEAAVWRPDKPTPTGDQVLADPRYSMYLVGWPRPGDFGLIAEQDAPVGAAWYRTYTDASHGYGFIAEDVPELSIAVIASRRHKGLVVASWSTSSTSAIARAIQP